MADTAYPKVPSSAWRVLRAKASTAPSTKFTPGTVAALLTMASPESASGNIVRPLRQLGLLTEEGGLTERGNKWRVDSTYPEACQEILDEIYPSELAALTTEDGSPNKASVKTWLEHRGFGSSNAGQMAATYSMIAEKTPPEILPPGADKKETAKKAPARKAPATSETAGLAPATRDASDANHERAVDDANGPKIHLDIQLHIPASASADQIDQIFASMAKHLYGR